ncbi:MULTISPECIES: hypothetical protein [Desulfovibrio]|uniref:Secreted protein n=2 Tax=Desulfovibrio TaxID=872 RepID=A0AA94L1J6_DESDE|nr:MULTISPECIES: hypothetical protein [Desulfovibrio]ATD82270.1 hypothetical protein CNY67_13425 [Desulfovibrio sp. G11]SFW29930.1 hypothetical protein SAMN02910291_00735 [Desulfovibrio desulfuricans]SPD35036.1 Hypothetical protein DSVG11_0929 [Desulfovibrio sp. G11]
MVKPVITIIFLCCVLLAAPLMASRTAAASNQGAKSQVADKAKQGVPCVDRSKARADQNRTVTVKKRKDAVHARAWTFREGSSLDAWQAQGTPADNLHSRAVAPAGGKAVDTAKGIDSALNAASGAHKNKSALALSVEDESSSWREPGPGCITPDENLSMESRHVVRAYADTTVGDDLSIGLGPELILRNEQRERPSSNKQPDSALGLGMQFKLDF